MQDPRPVIGHVLHRLDRAGAEVLAGDLARRLEDRYRFVFLCLDGVGALGEALRAEGLAVIDLKRKPGVDRRVAGRIRRCCQARAVDLLHAHQYTPFFYAACSRRWRRTPPILFTEHGRHYPDRRKLRRILANRFLVRPTDRVTAVGRFVKQALVDNEGIAEHRIEVIYNGIDPDTFAVADEHSRNEARRRLGVDSQRPLVMQVARFHPVKDHATAVRAFAKVVDDMPEAQLCLIGDGPTRPQIEAMAAELGVHEQVLFYGIRDDVARLLPAADVFMLSSVSEGVSVTLLEAMATGLPIAATDVGGNPEVVEHGRTGLLSPRGDFHSLGRNLIGLLGDQVTRRTYGIAGREKLMEAFTQQRMHRKYADLYQKILQIG